MSKSGLLVIGGMVTLTICLMSAKHLYSKTFIATEDNRRWIPSVQPPVTCKNYGGSTICQYGEIKSWQRHAVCACSLFDDESLHYLFNLPLSALAWRRIGFSFLVMIIGDPFSCEANSKIRYVVDTLLDMSHVVLLTVEGVERNHTAMISQTSRLFAASLVQRVPDDWADAYLVTTDADIWPLAEGVYHGFFDLPEGAEILHGEIGIVRVAGLNVLHIPLCYIGMKANTWKDVMTKSGEIEMPKSPDDILRYFYAVFGDEAVGRVLHGQQGWFMDQLMISLRVHEWKSREVNASEKVRQYAAYFRDARIDTLTLWNTSSIEGKVDAHAPRFVYEMDTWPAAIPLIRRLYPDTAVVRWCDNYAASFNKKSDCGIN